ncbi:head-tail adaptor protein [Rubellimicrobium aerolatum]|uniref:Head-tail adaptor protein n=1 Tax=Rubellimicrobium aerolatum TaxID=490979 RepID=A0ABW0SBJ8_9RHOB|nr:head-tail adaptor protein [Rubellimicrobium aerolatum]MBP1805511.1 head-tail adaptor [Rubellimicrobium aerolatum]
MTARRIPATARPATPHLRRRLLLEEPLRQPDGLGGYTRAWTELGALWAEIAPGAARVTAEPAGTHVTTPLRITVRGAAPGASSRPRPGQRFRDGQRLYPIRLVTEADPQGRYLLVLASEEAAL